MTTTSATIRDHRLELSADPQADAFARDGFLGPIRLFTPAECRRIAAYLHGDSFPAPADWYKGRGVHERFLFDLATRPAIVSLLTRLLGNDVVLWGVQAVIRGPGDVHPWHSDIESCAPDQRFASLWLGIEHTSRESALQLISRSHRLGITVQEARLERQMARAKGTKEAMLTVARELDSAAMLIEPDMTNGDALVFDGRLWHGTDNTRRTGRRLALLMQYAAARSPVRIPEPTSLDWPFRMRREPRPPAILIAGSDDGTVNRLVPPPTPLSQGAPMIATAIHHFDLPLANPSREWEPFHAFHGPTRTFADMSCHASVLVPGHSPHPPHAHVEEELLIPLVGEAEIVIATSPGDPAPRVERLAPGAFVYYPAWQHHTIRNTGTSPIAYLMFKWAAAPHGDGPRLATGIHRYNDAVAPAGADAFWFRRILEGATGSLGKLHAHLTVLAPGGGYAPHADAYDVAIVTLDGLIETLGQRVGPMSVVYYAAGEMHGMRNPGDVPARYLVFELHAPGVDVLPPPQPFAKALARRAVRLGKRIARPVWHAIRGYLR